MAGLALKRKDKRSGEPLATTRVTAPNGDVIEFVIVRAWEGAAKITVSAPPGYLILRGELVAQTAEVAE